MNRRSRLSTVTAITAAAITATALGGGAVAGLPRAGHRKRAISPAEVAARRDVGILLSRVRLPAGAAPSRTEPAGDHGLLAPLLALSATSARADRHAWWRTGGTPGELAAYIEAHAPRGAQPDGTGYGSGPNGRTLSIGFRWRPVRGLLGSRAIAFTMVALSATATGVLAQAESTWIVPRAADERIPAAARELEIFRGPVGARLARALTLTDPRRVARVVAFINRLGVVQPGVIACPALQVSGAHAIELRFRARQGGATLARARYIDYAPLDIASGPCTPVQFAVGGRWRTPLIGGDIARRLPHLAGAFAIRLGL